MLTVIHQNGAMELHRSVLGRQVGYSEGGVHHPSTEGSAHVACAVTS